MRKIIKIVFILTLIFGFFNLGLGLSFSIDLIDSIVLAICGIFGIILFVQNLPRIWIKIAILLIFAIMTYGGWFLWQLFGYESRIDRFWKVDSYTIKLQHKLHIGGPGCYWFLVSRNFLWNSMEYRLETQKYKATLPYPPEIITFKTSNRILQIECCENNITTLPDSLIVE